MNLNLEELLPYAWCLVPTALLGLAYLLWITRQYLIIIALTLLALAAMILPGGIAVLVGGLIVLTVYLLKKSGGVNVVIENSPHATVIIDQGVRADEKRMAGSR